MDTSMCLFLYCYIVPEEPALETAGPISLV